VLALENQRHILKCLCNKTERCCYLSLCKQGSYLLNRCHNFLVSFAERQNMSYKRRECTLLWTNKNRLLCILPAYRLTWRITSRMRYLRYRNKATLQKQSTQQKPADTTNKKSFHFTAPSCKVYDSQLTITHICAKSRAPISSSPHQARTLN